MELDRLIAENLHHLRTKQNLSIGQLAERTGLSKAVISQMEKGSSNPTVNTIWKLAEALHVPYSAILEPQRAEAEKITTGDLRFQVEDGGFRTGCYVPSTADRDFELFLLEYDPGNEHSTQGHPEDSEEYILMKSGRLHVSAAGKEYDLESGDVFYFDATGQHTFRNNSDETAQAYCLIVYPHGAEGRRNQDAE